MKRSTIVKLIKHFFGIEGMTAEIAADEMIRDDFPKNGIKTMGRVIGYFEYVKSVMAGGARIVGAK